ncbi:MAG: hypothetical protein R3200_08410 [Xanthomonadales bacterium]|nr:hypothetical protein [Xanthomonadales bacterium]
MRKRNSPTARTRALGLALAALAATAAAQEPPPGTEIYLAEVEGDRLGDAQRLTERPGYDNQPHFQPDGDAFWFTRIESGQADIYAMDLVTRSEKQVTETPLSEYSPTPSPNGGIAVVRVEADGAQRLWEFEIDGSNERLLFPELEPVGYFDWIDGNRVAAFLLGDTFTLQVATPGQPARVVADDIGRTIRRLPDGTVAYLDKARTPFRIVSFSTEDDTHRTLAEMPGEGEDFAVGPDGRLWAGVDGRILVHGSEGWVEAADFSGAGILGITRMAVSPNGSRLLFVAAE